jgi:hypothetical protein
MCPVYVMYKKPRNSLKNRQSLPQLLYIGHTFPEEESSAPRIGVLV